jgi:hypothetical protein
MASPHESAGSSIAVTTRLSGPRLAEISEYVAETIESNGAAVCFEGFDGSYPRFSVRRPDASTSDLTFHVEIASLGTISTGHTEIDTECARVNGLAKSYAAYIRFMQRFGDIVRIEDPAADVSVR